MACDRTPSNVIEDGNHDGDDDESGDGSHSEMMPVTLADGEDPGSTGNDDDDIDEVSDLWIPSPATVLMPPDVVQDEEQHQDGTEVVDTGGVPVQEAASAATSTTTPRRPSKEVRSLASYNSIGCDPIYNGDSSGRTRSAARRGQVGERTAVGLGGGVSSNVDLVDRTGSESSEDGEETCCAWHECKSGGAIVQGDDTFQCASGKREAHDECRSNSKDPICIGCIKNSAHSSDAKESGVVKIQALLRGYIVRLHDNTACQFVPIMAMTNPDTGRFNQNELYETFRDVGRNTVFEMARRSDHIQRLESNVQRLTLIMQDRDTMIASQETVNSILSEDRDRLRGENETHEGTITNLEEAIVGLNRDIVNQTVENDALTQENLNLTRDNQRLRDVRQHAHDILENTS